VCPVTATPTSPEPSQRGRRYPFRHHRPRVGAAGGAAATACLHPRRWRPARSAPAPGGDRRHPLPGPQRLCVARAASRLPTVRTVYGCFARWAADGTLDRVHDALRDQVRLDAGRRQPSAAIIDSQSVRAAETVPRASRGFDAGKKVNGRKRHIAVDTLGLLLVVLVTAASVQDRDAARPLLWRLRVKLRRIRLVWADAGYAGKLVVWAATALGLRVDIIRRRLAHAFEVLPRRWVVERTFAWISRHRRTVRDYERLPDHHRAMVTWAMTTVTTRRLARRHRPARTPTPALPRAA
jgi:transposase